MKNTLTPSELFSLKGKSALVVGASGALGGAAAHALAAAGANLTLAGSNSETLKRRAQEMEHYGVSITVHIGRPETQDDAQEMINTATQTSPLDIVVCASGTSVVKPITDMQPDEFDKVMDANVRQSWLVCRAASKVMIEQNRGGKMILVSSVRAHFATPAGTSAYGTSKAAINMLTRSLAVELGPHNICVNAIAPTVFRSSLTSWLFEPESADKRQQVLNRIPIGRLGEPEDFNGIFMFLASQASNLITGEIINIDGGFSCN
ncbi:MAG: oxidoreductase [Alteromonadaceae bacterium]|uniref:SDR family NAD(P)-dependent oxidoreductase n=1 Tax=Paraglaciecola chathamensis TaxID=368405 RepID=UPI000C4112AE|nr:SDR family oxidoreductase [Paraglaciecola agarilytica]MBN26122.1 oxidoreductase [Alteromonadaceae bacterium]|tara:strand:+ start:42909 stop:43697 length:789 start_codon:yes stop_codon:yes gene_type:complete